LLLFVVCLFVCLLVLLLLLLLLLLLFRTFQSFLRSRLRSCIEKIMKLDSNALVVVSGDLNDGPGRKSD
jgi:hypothetical protein